MTACELVKIKDTQLAVRIQRKENLAVKTQRSILGIRINDCSQTLVRDRKTDIAIQINRASSLRALIETSKIGVRFVKGVTINNPDPFPPAEGAERIECLFEADSDITVNKVVALLSNERIEHADKDTLAHCGLVLGVAIQSGVAGELIKVIRFGKVNGASPGSVADELFLGNNGAMTATVPTSGFWQKIGEQQKAAEFFVDMSEPIGDL